MIVNMPANISYAHTYFHRSSPRDCSKNTLPSTHDYIPIPSYMARLEHTHTYKHFILYTAKATGYSAHALGFNGQYRAEG